MIKFFLFSIAVFFVTVSASLHASEQDEYTLGPGDTISIKVYREDDLNSEVRLNRQSNFNFPLIGEVSAQNLSVSGLEAKIADMLKDGFIVNPRVIVSIIEYRQIFVLGAVKQPGGYEYQPNLTINKAISLAGGYSERADRDAVSIDRSGRSKLIIDFNVHSVVKPGDIITVKESFF